MKPPVPISTSIRIIVVLLLMLLASAATFSALVRRLTSRRRWTAVADWAKQAGFKIATHRNDDSSGSLQILERGGAVITLCLTRGSTQLIQAQTEGPASDSLPSPVVQFWNLLVRRLDREWSSAGMRPTNSPSSVLDFYSLSSFPLAGGTERFVLFAADAEAAAAFPESKCRSLLPPDIGLLLHRGDLIVDFSARPFDDLEFDRINSLAEQLVERLGVSTK